MARKVHANWLAIVRARKFDAKWIVSTLLRLFLVVAVLQSMMVRFFRHPALTFYGILSESRAVWVH